MLGIHLTKRRMFLGHLKTPATILNHLRVKPQSTILVVRAKRRKNLRVRLDPHQFPWLQAEHRSRCFRACPAAKRKRHAAPTSLEPVVQCEQRTISDAQLREFAITGK